MQTSNKAPVRRDHDLIVVPDARPPRRWGMVAAITAAVLAALLVGGAIGYAIQRANVRDLEAQLSGSTDQRQAVVTDVAASLRRIDALEATVADLRGEIDVQRRAVAVERASKRESRRLLASARDELAAAQADLRQATGPPLGDGTSVAKVVAVGASQSPPKVVLDLGRWFTGPAARRAAIEDGVITSTGRLPNPRYFRNPAPNWRIMPLDLGATVTYWRFGSRAGSSTVSIAEFQEIARLASPWAQRVTADPYRVTVQNGVVTALQQQRYP